VLFRDLPELAQFFDEGGLKMKSFVDTMPEPTRKIYEEVLVAPVVKVYEEKLKQAQMEKTEAKLERERIEAELEKTEAELEKTEAELEKTEAELEKERIEAKLEKEKVEGNLRTTCQQVILNKFPNISAGALMAVNQLSFSQHNQLLRGLDKIRDVHECEAFLKNL
jgi:chromosome segregation ATPase